MAENIEGSRGGRGMMILSVLVGALTIVSASNMYLLLEARNDIDAENNQEEEILGPPPVPIFVKVGPLTVNLRPDGYGQRLLYTSLSLRVGDEETKDLIESHMPEVHSRLLLLLSRHSAEELISPDGKQTLTENIMALFEKPLTHPQPPLTINTVLFTDFIVQ